MFFSGHATDGIKLAKILTSSSPGQPFHGPTSRRGGRAWPRGDGSLAPARAPGPAGLSLRTCEPHLNLSVYEIRRLLQFY